MDPKLPQQDRRGGEGGQSVADSSQKPVDILWFELVDGASRRGQQCIFKRNNIKIDLPSRTPFLIQTNPMLFDIRKYLMLAYWLFT